MKSKVGIEGFLLIGTVKQVMNAMNVRGSIEGSVKNFIQRLYYEQAKWGVK